MKRLDNVTLPANIIQELFEAASEMPRATPKAGAASTIHDFQIAASEVWRLDRILRIIESFTALQVAIFSIHSVETTRIEVFVSPNQTTVVVLSIKKLDAYAKPGLYWRNCKGKNWEFASGRMDFLLQQTALHRKYFSGVPVDDTYVFVKIWNVRQQKWQEREAL